MMNAQMPPRSSGHAPAVLALAVAALWTCGAAVGDTNLDSCICALGEPSCTFDNRLGSPTACGAGLIARLRLDGSRCYCDEDCATSAAGCCPDYSAVCLTNAPSDPPTAQPSLSPSEPPTTSSPTATPTPGPTEVPTDVPSSAAPSVAPTAVPSSSGPTAAPTRAPLTPPTSNPTDAPAPSEPTHAPSASPSASSPASTVAPAAVPGTPDPTPAPLTARTAAPSSVPTRVPTAPPSESEAPNTNLDSCVCVAGEPGCVYDARVGNESSCMSSVARLRADGGRCFCDASCGGTTAGCCPDFAAVCLTPAPSAPPSLAPSAAPTAAVPTLPLVPAPPTSLGGTGDSSSDKSASPTFGIAMGVVAGVFLIVLFVICVVIPSRRKRHQENRLNMSKFSAAATQDEPGAMHALAPDAAERRQMDALLVAAVKGSDVAAASELPTTASSPNSSLTSSPTSYTKPEPYSPLDSPGSPIEYMPGMFQRPRAAPQEPVYAVASDGQGMPGVQYCDNPAQSTSIQYASTSGTVQYASAAGTNININTRPDSSIPPMSSRTQQPLYDQISFVKGSATPTADGNAPIYATVGKSNLKSATGSVATRRGTKALSIAAQSNPYDNREYASPSLPFQEPTSPGSPTRLSVV